MGDIDQSQFQTQKIHGLADKTVAEESDTENIASQLHNNNVHIMSKEEWANEKKLKIVQKNREDRKKED